MKYIFLIAIFWAQFSYAYLTPTAGFSSQTTAVQASNGTVGAPSVSFANSSDAGFYRVGADDLGLAIAGAQLFDFKTGQVTLTGTTQFTWNGGSSSTAQMVVGSVTTGGSLFVRTGSLSSTFDGAYSSLESVVNIHAVGVQSAGGYGSTLKFYTSLGADQVLVAQMASDGTFTSLGGVRIATAASRPSCAVGIRGLTWIVQGATDVADSYQACMKKSDNTYAWVVVKDAP